MTLPLLFNGERTSDLVHPNFLHINSEIWVRHSGSKRKHIRSPPSSPSLTRLLHFCRISNNKSPQLRYLLVFYCCINCGAFFGVATAYAEHDIGEQHDLLLLEGRCSVLYTGFWLAYLLPAILYMCALSLVESDIVLTPCVHSA